MDDIQHRPLHAMIEHIHSENEHEPRDQHHFVEETPT
jgi:hypothetical protein